MAGARIQRQQQLLQADGPSYETVLEESVVHRLAVPTAVMAAQLRHLIRTVSDQPRITLRILPHDVPIHGGLLPQASFFLFTFPDPDDLPVAVVDTATTDLVLTEDQEVDRYLKQYDRLREAALSPGDSAVFLHQVLARLRDEAGPHR